MTEKDLVGNDREVLDKLKKVVLDGLDKKGGLTANAKRDN